MGIATLIRYYFGDRRAILQIAQHPSSLWIGFLFVLAAGFAREYDGQYLVREPWHVLIPLPVSIALSLVFFGLFRAGMKRTEEYPGFWPAYRSFLALIWMTAPLALLYAIPYERFLSAGDSIRANLWTLGIVVLWRALLMVRIARILFGANYVGALCIVMLVGDVILLPASFRLATPAILSGMGGIRQSESERILSGTALAVAAIGVYSGLVWLFGALIAIGSRHMRWQAQFENREPHAPASWPLKSLAVACVLVWIFVLPSTQPEQHLRWDAERMLNQGQIASALTMMSAHAPSEFPPYWDSPPQSLYGEDHPPLLDVMKTLVECRPAPWVRQHFIAKFARQYLEDRLAYHGGERSWPRVEWLLQELDEGPSLLDQYRANIEFTREVLRGESPASRPAAIPATRTVGKETP